MYSCSMKFTIILVFYMIKRSKNNSIIKNKKASSIDEA